MARCPRCLKPVDEERSCVDSHCSDRVQGSSLRPLAMTFALVGLVHLALVWKIGTPAVEPPVPAMFWFFVAVCWLFVNSATTIALYAACVFAFERDTRAFTAWATRAIDMLRATARGAEFPARPKSSSSRG